eukprot:2244515-Rhodomonas_salina.1
MMMSQPLRLNTPKAFFNNVLRNHDPRQATATVKVGGGSESTPEGGRVGWMAGEGERGRREREEQERGRGADASGWGGRRLRRKM